LGERAAPKKALFSYKKERKVGPPKKIQQVIPPGLFSHKVEKTHFSVFLNKKKNLCVVVFFWRNTGFLRIPLKSYSKGYKTPKSKNSSRKLWKYFNSNRGRNPPQTPMWGKRVSPRFRKNVNPGPSTLWKIFTG